MVCVCYQVLTLFFIMKPFTRSVVRKLPIISRYRECLVKSDRSLKPPTVVAYLAHVSSFITELGIAMNVTRVETAREGNALVLAASRRWSPLKRRRNSTITARLLTVSRDEVCEVLLRASRKRNVQSMASFCSAVGVFYQWLESIGLLEENHFEAVRGRLEFRWQTFRDSIECCRL